MPQSGAPVDERWTTRRGAGASTGRLRRPDADPHLPWIRLTALTRHDAGCPQLSPAAMNLLTTTYAISGQRRPRWLACGRAGSEAAAGRGRPGLERRRRRGSCPAASGKPSRPVPSQVLAHVVPGAMAGCSAATAEDHPRQLLSCRGTQEAKTVKFRVERDVLAEAVAWAARSLPAPPERPGAGGRA